MTQRQYIYLSVKDDNEDKALLLSTAKPFDTKHLALVYLINRNEYIFYKYDPRSWSDMITLNNEYEVLCKYNEYFQFREKKFWEFMNMVKDIKNGKIPNCKIEHVS